MTGCDTTLHSQPGEAVLHRPGTAHTAHTHTHTDTHTHTHTHTHTQTHTHTSDVTLWDKRRNADILEETRELPVEEHATKVEEAPVVRTPTENARPSATEAASKVQTKRKEEEARRDISAMGRSDQQRSNQNR